MRADVDLDAVWRRWVSADLWADDDPDTAAAVPDGSDVGARGWVKPVRGPKSRIAVSVSVPRERFDIVSRILGARMFFQHEVGVQIDAGFPSVIASIVSHSGGVLRWELPQENAS